MVVRRVRRLGGREEIFAPTERPTASPSAATYPVTHLPLPMDSSNPYRYIHTYIDRYTKASHPPSIYSATPASSGGVAPGLCPSPTLAPQVRTGATPLAASTPPLSKRENQLFEAPYSSLVIAVTDQLPYPILPPPPCCTNMSVQDTQSADLASFEAICAYDWAADKEFQVKHPPSPLPPPPSQPNCKNEPPGRLVNRSELCNRPVCSLSYHQHLPQNKQPR